jgi:hypothetical protein
LAKLTKTIIRSTKDVSITNDINAVIRYRQRLDNAHRKKQKGKDGFHLSGDITKPADDKLFCSRSLEIQRRYADQLVPWQPNVKLAKTFEHGHSLHRMLQTWLRDVGPATEFNAGLYGRWECRRCDKLFYAFAPVKCMFCKADIYALKYREYPLSNKEFETTTTADGLYWVKLNGEWEEWLLEAKSIHQRSTYYGDVGFDELTEPMEKHRGQAQGYGALRKLELTKGPTKKLPKGFTEWPKFKGIIYLYYGKDSDDIKEFHEPYKRGYWETVSGRIKAIQEHELNNTFSKRIKVCTDIAAAKKATYCPVIELCFKMKKTKV